MAPLKSGACTGAGLASAAEWSPLEFPSL